MQTKCCIYCRVSSERQVNEGHGLDSQEYRCRERAKQKGYEVVKVFRDEGISGSIAERPAITELLSYLDSRPGSVVLIDDLSRLDRDVKVHTILRGALKEREARLECLNMELDDENELSEAMENIAVVFNQLHRKTNRKQVIQKQKARIEAGYWSFCHPKGLRYYKDSIHGKLLRRDEPYATIFKDAIEEYRDGVFSTLDEVREYIAQSYKSRGLTDKIGLEGVRRILGELLYTGWVEYPPWNVTLRLGHHDGFISLDTYNRVQDILRGRSKPRLREDYNKDFPLRRLVVCRKCGGALTGSWNKGRTERYPNYFCRAIGCSYRYKVIHKDEIEARFESVLTEANPGSETLDLALEVLKDVWQQSKASNEATQAQNEAKTRELEELIANSVNAAIRTRDLGMRQTYEDKVTELRTELEKLMSTTSPKYTDEEFGTATDRVIGALKNPLGMWKSDLVADKQTIFNMYFGSKLPYDRIEGFGTAKLDPTIELIRSLGTEKRALVEVAGIEPASEKEYCQRLQAYSDL